MAKRTKLDCVNTILSNVGQAPVTSLSTGNPLVEMAELTLDEITSAVQSEGWYFNTELAYTFNPDSNGAIFVPDNVLSLDTKPYSAVQVVQRQRKLYNKVDHTFAFSQPVDCDVVWLEDFEDMPEPFKNYVTIRAANVFAGRSVASSEAVKFGEREELYARAAAIEYDTKQGDYSFFETREGANTYQSFLPINVLRRN